jgi:glycosyltransferase involved in cell wall biosynthesis
MKIGIDISMLVYAGSGVATYTTSLVKALLRKYPDHSYHLFYSSLRRPKNFHQLEEFEQMGAHVHAFRFPPRVLAYLWNRHMMLPVEWLIGKVDVYHSSDFLRPPLLSDTIGITTLHDLTWKLFPEYHTDDIVKAHEKKLDRTITNDDIILTDSQNTKKDLLKIYPEIKTQNEVHVLPLGIDSQYKKISDITKLKSVLKKYDIAYGKKYILYVGAIEPRKNVDRSIRVFAKLVKEKVYEDMEYLIVGRAGWKNEEVFQTITELNLQKKVRFVGFVATEDLPFVYNGAHALMYLSSYEGFGLPPLEATACGIPTLLYKNSSLKEIMPADYPFAEEKKEVETLKLLLKKGKQEVAKIHIPDWNTYADRFIEILKQKMSSS